MTKIILFTIAGTLVAWFAVARFMASTDHMPATFTIESHNAEVEREEAKKKVEAAKQKIAEVKDNRALDAKSVPASQKVARSNVERPASIDNRQPMPASATVRLTEEQKGLTIRSVRENDASAVNEDLQTIATVPRLASDESEMELSEEEQQLAQAESVLAIADDAEVSEAVRQDSDADMQASSAEEKNEPIETASNAPRATMPTTTAVRKDALKKPIESVEALNIAYALPNTTSCAEPIESYPQVGVLYRPSSFAIKGQSLSSIDQLIRLHQKCQGGKFIVLNNETDEEGVDERLTGLRQDEVKYYLLQRRIPKDDIIFSDKL